MSDGPINLENETIRLLTKGLRASHHLSLPYLPWSNSAVERLGKEILGVARALLSQLQLHHHDWSKPVLLFQSALNNAQKQQRNNVSPITAFNGCPPSPSISTFLRSLDSKSITLTDAKNRKPFNISTWTAFMGDLHSMVHAYEN